MKKKLSFMLVLALLLSLCACGMDTTQSTDPDHAHQGTIHQETSSSDNPSELKQDSTVSTTCSHSYADATCTAPKTCTKCGATEGSTAGHNWSNATCDAPKTCSLCGATEGNAAGHNWSNATCDAPKTCSVCGATEGSAAGHNWQAATCEAPKTCSVCGVEKGSAKGHSYAGGTCSACGAEDPNYTSITYVLNTKSKKFHRLSCSKLPTENRKDTTMSREEIIDAGYDPCKLCHP